MQQKFGDHWHPLGFFSRKFSDTESCYSTFDQELLAAHTFQLWIDNKPLVNALPCVTARISLYKKNSSNIWLSFPNSM
jgi:hypothetical protein